MKKKASIILAAAAAMCLAFPVSCMAEAEQEQYPIEQTVLMEANGVNVTLDSAYADKYSTIALNLAVENSTEKNLIFEMTNVRVGDFYFSNLDPKLYYNGSEDLYLNNYIAPGSNTVVAELPMLRTEAPMTNYDQVGFDLQVYEAEQNSNGEWYVITDASLNATPVAEMMDISIALDPAAEAPELDTAAMGEPVIVADENNVRFTVYPMETYARSKEWVFLIENNADVPTLMPEPFDLSNYPDVTEDMHGGIIANGTELGYSDDWIFLIRLMYTKPGTKTVASASVTCMADKAIESITVNNAIALIGGDSWTWIPFSITE